MSTVLTPHTRNRAAPRFGELSALQAELTQRLADLPPMYATVSSNSDDGKSVRICLPIDYRDQFADVSMGQFIVYCYPGNCLRAAPLPLGDALVAQIESELAKEERSTLISDVKANRQIVQLDAKGRLRLSYALTDVVGIKKEVVFCCQSWWIELWAKEIRAARLAIPLLSQVFPGFPPDSLTGPGLPK